MGTRAQVLGKTGPQIRKDVEECNLVEKGHIREHMVVLGAESNSSPYLPHILAEYEVVSFGFLFTERYGDGVEPTSNRFLVLITEHGCKG